MRLTWTLATVALLGPGNAGAELLTLDGAVERALRASPEAMAAQARAEAATARARQAAASRWLSLDLSETYVGTDNPAEAFALRLNQERFDTEAFFRSDPNNPPWLDTWVTRLEASVPLYTGGKLAGRVSQAQLMAEASAAEGTHARERVAFETITAFTNLAKARDYLELVTTARATTAEHLRLAEQIAGQGMILEAEVLKARVYLAEMDELLAQAANGARLAEAALNFAMGGDQGTRWELAPLPPTEPAGGTVEGWVASALERRRDLTAARLKLEAGRLEEKVARSALLPEVAVVGRYDLYDDSPFGANGGSGTIVGVARVNLFRGGADGAALAAARHDTASLASGVRRFEEGLELETRQAWHDLETAAARQGTASASLAAARQALAVRQARFRQGLDRMIDLLDAETTLREAEVRELVARYDLSLARFRLQFAAGAPLVDPVSPEEEER